VSFTVEPEDHYGVGVYREYRNHGCVPLMLEMRSIKAD